MNINLDGRSIPIKKFDLRTMAQHASICMIAKRGSGKSWVCRDILQHFSDIPGGVIIAPTDEMNCFYGNFFPSTYIHYKYNSEIIERMLYRQAKIIEKERQKKKFGKKIDSRAILVMDDCLSSKGSWMKDEPIMKMFFDGRHYKVMYILTMQFPLGISPELRGNFDYIFLLAEDFYSNQKRIYEHYAGMFPNLETFRQVFTQITQDYGSLVIVNRGARASFLEKVFWFKAGPANESLMGSSQFRKYHKYNFDENWKSKKKPLDLNKFIGRKKSNIKIKIDKIIPE
jgi:hypothetical protein